MVSKDLLAQFDEIQEKITAFETVKTALDTTDDNSNQHPLLELSHKTRLGKVRRAVASELTFFKALYQQSPNYQKKLAEEQEEKSMQLS